MTATIIRDGTSQEERLLPALRDGYFCVDEMRLEQLLALSAGFAGLLKYYGLDLRPDGDWSALFESDDAAVLAALLATSLKQSEAAMRRDLKQWFPVLRKELLDGSKSPEGLPTLALALRIDTWHRQLGAMSSIAAVRAHNRISDSIVEILAAELRALQGFLRSIGVPHADAVFARFSRVWRLDERNEEWPNNGGNVEAEIRFLKANFYAFRNAVAMLQETAAALLNESLGRSNREPAMGLFIAFLQLFSKVQQRINDFTSKHLDFYYGDVLKIARNGFVPDSTHLIFTPDVAGREVGIARGAEFRAGVDENNVDLIYSADTDLLVTDARVRALHTIYFERDQLVSPENQLRIHGDDMRMYATGAKLNHIEVADGPPRTDGEMPTQPLFGSSRRAGGKRMFENARLGFAVASSALFLQEGRREVTLIVRFAPDNGLEAFVHELADLLDTSVPDAFFKAFRQMFKISLTAETGWIDVGEYLPLCRLVDPDCEPDSLTIRFQLPDSAAAVVGYAVGVHGERFDTSLPVLKAVINPESYFYSYSLLRAMTVREIAIEACVSGCTDIQVYNQFGRLNANAQFNPFGPLPTVSDYFVVGCREAAQKKLTAFEVDVEWSGLPAGPEGFEGYYRGYPMKFDNAVFRASLAVLRDRKWQPGSGERPEIGLFEDVPDAGESGSREVAAKRRFSFDGLCEFARPLGQVSAAEFGYDALAKDGFFRVTLAGPQYAFGHKNFSMVMSEVMTENAKRNGFSIFKLLRKLRLPRRPQMRTFIPKSRTIRLLPNLLSGSAQQTKKSPLAGPLPESLLPLKPMPAQPYTPQINAISVNYTAATTINFENVTSTEQGKVEEKIYHLHPLGLEALSPKLHGHIHLVPRYDADGNLLIGLSASDLTGPLSLYFRLNDDSLPEAGAVDFGFAWHYLSSNRWKPFTQAQVVSDDTFGFLRSGIVVLDVPADIDRNNTILPNDLYWIRVSSSNARLYALCSLHSVHAQALRVSWRKQEGNTPSHLAKRLAAGTISTPKRTIPGIAAIHQIDHSSGGMPDEGRGEWVARISERLRHKNRAVTPWDFERLILQRFPELYKVKCFPCMSGDPAHRGQVMPGQLLIAVIPYPKPSASGNFPAGNFQPMANALLLREVREFVAGLASSFATIEVRNPAYERIQVRCRVRLRKGVPRGLSLKRLNRTIVDYLSPWSEDGYKARFDWRLRCNEIQSLMHSLDYVESVSAVSMLQISETGNGRYRLFDTARHHDADVRPGHPWSIAVPATQHLIGTMDAMGVCSPEATGIAELAIGNTFILSGNHHA